MPSGPDNRAELLRLKKEVRLLRAALKRLPPDLETILARRGFRIYKKEPAEDLLIPAGRSLDAYYRMLHKYSFRLFLRDIIKHQDGFTLEDVTRYATARVTRGYIDYLLALGLIRQKGSSLVLSKQPVRSFGSTLEWYVAELFRREFKAEAVWGVKFRRPAVGGDYDVLARVDSSLFYLEVKSSPPKQIYDSEIAAFLDRTADLSPEIAVFLMDTELRMKDKIVPMFELELSRREADPPRVNRLERELFAVGSGIFIINAKEEILRNIRVVLSRYYRERGARREAR